MANSSNSKSTIYNKNSHYHNKKRINSLNFFAGDIRPEWEDNRNRGGWTYTLQFEEKNYSEIPKLLDVMQKYWTLLILWVIGESIVGSKFVNRSSNK